MTVVAMYLKRGIGKMVDEVRMFHGIYPAGTKKRDAERKLPSPEYCHNLLRVR